jgi:hypothetical protein
VLQQVIEDNGFYEQLKEKFYTPKVQQIVKLRNSMTRNTARKPLRSSEIVSRYVNRDGFMNIHKKANKVPPKIARVPK